MILQHCPKTYRGKPYGCGYGPLHPTLAFLDLGGMCPGCKKEFRPYRKPRPKQPRQGELCKVRTVAGEYYCREATADGIYCQRHAFLNYQ